MEHADRELLLKLSVKDKYLSRLMVEHDSLEKELSRFSGKFFLTKEEDQLQRELKVKKLQGVDKIMQALAKHRASSPTLKLVVNS